MIYIYELIAAVVLTFVIFLNKEDFYETDSD